MSDNETYSTSSDMSSSRKNASVYSCRLCRFKHPLRKCKRFLNMNTVKRLQTVTKYGYCRNCLAHKHSQGRCFTRTGCRYCHQYHHSLLHIHPRLRGGKSTKALSTTSLNTNFRKDTSPKPVVRMSTSVIKPEPTVHIEKQTSNTSLSAILKQNAVILLPTALVYLNCPQDLFKARCLLDSGSKYSSISSKIVNQLRLTTLTLNKETICPTTLVSLFDRDVKIEATLRVINRISIHTPGKTLPKSIGAKFENIVLADSTFYKSASVDIILGIDVYSRVITEGILNRPGIPTAQNTIFGWTIYGTFTT